MCEWVCGNPALPAAQDVPSFYSPPPPRPEQGARVYVPIYDQLRFCGWFLSGTSVRVARVTWGFLRQGSAFPCIAQRLCLDGCNRQQESRECQGLLPETLHGLGEENALQTLNTILDPLEGKETSFEPYLD